MKRGFTLIELMIVIAIIAIIAAIAIPGFIRARIAANERNASTSMKAIVSAEENFKGSDVDRNGMQDYWTGDISGLYCITFFSTSRPISCISDLPICYADTFRLADSGGTFQGADNDGDGSPDTVYDASVLGGGRGPKAGYWHQVLLLDELGNSFGVNTDGQGPIHNFGQFGFCAVPASWDATGNYAFIINAIGAVLRHDFGPNTTLCAPGVQIIEFAPGFPLDFPAPAALSTWGKVE